MPLNEYRAKRDFTRSPEPPGKPATKRRPPARRLFCVQKHLATQLHYDFRLEHNGVLLSWAVPKGPSLDPSVKRLAMHVEDHPVEYGEFEGVIPEGYGAGVVMLWDRGTWTPQVDDVEAALRKGDLKFTLDGYKLKGSWVLVRTRGADSRSWLLIKHRDEWAGELDITEFAPRSVTSDNDLEEILAAESPSVWLSNRPAAARSNAALARIIERVAALKAEREASSRGRQAAPRARQRAPRARKRSPSSRPMSKPEARRPAKRR